MTPVGRALTVRRFYRDEQYIFELERDLVAFKALVDEYEALLRGTASEVEPEPGPAQPAAIAPPPVIVAPIAVPATASAVPAVPIVPIVPTPAIVPPPPTAGSLPLDIFN